MNRQENITLVRRLYDEVYTKNNLAVFDQFFTKDVKLQDAGTNHFKGGVSGLKERETMYRTAFPDKTIKINEIYGTDDDRVIVEWTGTGTHKGKLGDIPSSGKTFKTTGIAIYHLTNGKISEIAQCWDKLSLLEQIGAIETTGALHR